MGAVRVSQIIVTPLKRIPLADGDVLHGIKRTDPGFLGFGEAYFSMIQGGAVKAWKRHLLMTLNLVVPVGSVRFVFVDEENGERVELVHPDRYARLTVPPGIWFGFQGVAKPFSLVMNVADIPHSPAEVERKNLNEIEYDWEIKK